MSRRRKDPLRSLTDDERRELVHLSRSRTAPAVRAARAVVLLAVAGLSAPITLPEELPAYFRSCYTLLGSE